MKQDFEFISDDQKNVKNDLHIFPIVNKKVVNFRTNFILFVLQTSYSYSLLYSNMVQNGTVLLNSILKKRPFFELQLSFSPPPPPPPNG